MSLCLKLKRLRYRKIYPPVFTLTFINQKRNGFQNSLQKKKKEVKNYNKHGGRNANNISNFQSKIHWVRR